MGSRWSFGGVVAALLGSLLAGGCDSSTGVLIEVTRGDSVPADVGRLAFHVGVDGMIADQPRSYVDPNPEPDVRLDGRDLAEDPYRLLIRPREHAEAEVMVAVVGYSGGDVVGFGALERPVRFVDGEVAMWRITLESELPGGFETGDTGCLGWFDGGGEFVSIGRPRDQDCDGWTDDDCNDLDPGINPGANETCGNAVDEDCDDQADEDVDEDGDLVTTCGGDCNDHDDSVSPLTEERCDGSDNDCDGMCDEGEDRDGDGYTECGSKLIEGGTQCLFDPDRPDCDDFDDDVHPGAAEVCDGVDNDCNQVCDDASAGLDRDGDGFTSCGSITDHCGRSDRHQDCDDRDGAIHPGAAEVCDGVDNDCDGQRLQRAPCFAVGGEPEECFFGERDCAEQDGEAGDWAGDCEPIVGPLEAVPPELCGAYGACDAVPESRPDPYTCSIENALPIDSCTVTYKIKAGAQCPGSEVVLPTDGLLDCSWAVVGGAPQGDFSVGLRDLLQPGDSPSPVLGVCNAVLVVTTAGKGPPSPHVVLLSRTELGQEPVRFAVSLAPALVDACEPPRGLECQSLPPP